MRAPIALFFIMGLILSSRSQQIETLQKKKSILNNNIRLMQDSIGKIDKLIAKIKLEEITKGKKYMIGIMYEPTIVKESYQEGSDIIDNISAGDTVKIYKWRLWDLFIEYGNGKSGYIGEVYVKKNDSLNTFLQYLRENANDDRQKEIEDQALKAKKNQQIAMQQEKAERRKSINTKFSKYGTTVVNKITEKLIWIGMTKDMAIASWGQPERINKTVSSSGVKEQWVYDSDYLYFKEGILQSYQTRR